MKGGKGVEVWVVDAPTERGWGGGAGWGLLSRLIIPIYFSVCWLHECRYL